MQGIRLSTHPVLYALDLEMYVYHKKPIADVGISLDNNIYVTDFIREVGGFLSKCPIAVDRDLRDRVLAANKRWIIDPTIQSDHIRDSLWATLKHNYNLLCNITREDQLVSLDCGCSVFMIPFSAIRCMKRTREPRVFPYLLANSLVRGAVYVRERYKIKAAKHSYGS